MNNKKIIIAITGASGAIYSKLLIEKLKAHNHDIEKIAIVFSKNAEIPCDMISYYMGV